MGGGAVGSSTMKNRVEVTTPGGDTTPMRALTAPNGTVAMTVVAVGGEFGAVARSPNSTSVTLARLVPVIVTIEPRSPLSGTNDVIVGRAIVGDGDGEGAGVGSTIGIVGNGRLGGGSAVGGAGGVKLGGGVSEADDSGSEAEGSGGEADGRPPVALADGGATVPMTGSPSCVSGEPLALVAFIRSQPDRTSASARRTAKRLLTRPRTG